jgi:two-component system cell cycle response regulator DivK
MVAAASESAPLILVIDDVEDNRDVYEQFLRHAGFRVALAADGEDGLAKAVTLQPNVIVLDLGLPLLDGWEVARRLKDSQPTKTIPLIALTGHVTKESRDRAVAAGVDEYCTKPCAPTDLVATIRRHLKLRADLLG